MGAFKNETKKGVKQVTKQTVMKGGHVVYVRHHKSAFENSENMMNYTFGNCLII